MRRLLSMPLRWLDARIDARIERAERLKVEGVLLMIRGDRSAVAMRETLPPGLQTLAGRAAEDLRDTVALNDAAAPKRGDDWMGA